MLHGICAQLHLDASAIRQWLSRTVTNHRKGRCRDVFGSPDGSKRVLVVGIRSEDRSQKGALVDPEVDRGRRSRSPLVPSGRRDCAAKIESYLVYAPGWGVSQHQFTGRLPVGAARADNPKRMNPRRLDDEGPFSRGEVGTIPIDSCRKGWTVNECMQCRGPMQFPARSISRVVA